MEYQMIKILLKTIIVCNIFITSIAAQAGVIAIEDWFDAGGSNSGGLTQSQFSDSLFFAVAQDVDYSPGDTYEVTEGWHIASYDEYSFLHNIYNDSFQGYNMANQDGWTGYKNTSGHTNYYFALSDMWSNAHTNKAVHAGTPANHNNLNDYRRDGDFLHGYRKTYLAGIVVIKDNDGAQAWGTTSQVPEPSTLAIFALGLMGLASRRFKKQS
jgi:hypothetical protein